MIIENVHYNSVLFWKILYYIYVQVLGIWLDSLKHDNWTFVTHLAKDFPVYNPVAAVKMTIKSQLSISHIIVVFVNATLTNCLSINNARTRGEFNIYFKCRQTFLFLGVVSLTGYLDVKTEHIWSPCIKY